MYKKQVNDQRRFKESNRSKKLNIVRDFKIIFYSVPDNISKAMRAVYEKKYSIYRAAKVFGVDPNTLRRR